MVNMGEPQAILQILDAAGTIGLLVYVVVAMSRGWLIRRGEHEAALKREEQWRQLALTGIGLTDRALETRSEAPWRERP